MAKKKGTVIKFTVGIQNIEVNLDDKKINKILDDKAKALNSNDDKSFAVAEVLSTIIELFSTRYGRIGGLKVWLGIESTLLTRKGEVIGYKRNHMVYDPFKDALWKPIKKEIERRMQKRLSA